MRKIKNQPFVTFIVPTLNAQKYLELCLGSIRRQQYPKNKYEIILPDGGSTDDTFKIAKKYRAKIIKNKFVDQESGKSLGIQRSKGDIVVLMDSDNEIIKKDWLLKMVKPLVSDSTLFGVESFYFPSKNDNIFNKYSMLAHIADPFSRAIAASLKRKKKNGYIEYTIPGKSAYPLGANGFLWNKKIIKKVGMYKPKFEESNFSYYILQEGYNRFARVEGYGIYHYHIESIWDFVGKRLKIGNKFLNRKDEKRKTWLEGVSKQRMLFSYLYCLTFIGPAIEGVYNFSKTREKAWLLHPLMAFLSVGTYTIVFIRRIIEK